MKKKNLIYLVILMALILKGIECQSNVKNQKKKTNWIILFDGSSTDKWKSIHSNEFPKEGWKVEGNLLTVLAKTGSTPAGKDIITKDQYSNFELELEIKLTEGANSGIKYFVVDDFPRHEGQYLGLEYQLIDDQRHSDAKLGSNGNRTIASLYDLIPANKNKEVNPPGQWNKVKILVDENHVEHWLNEQKVLEFDRKSDVFRQLIVFSKYKDIQKFGEIPKGHILLQGHSDEVAFRSIKIRTW